MSDQESQDAIPVDEDVEGHRVMGDGFGDDRVPRNAAASRSPSSAAKAEGGTVNADNDDDVEGHVIVPQTGRPAHEMDRRRD